MAKGKSKKQQLYLGIAILIVAAGIIMAALDAAGVVSWEELFSAARLTDKPVSVVEGELQVHVIDVGQADSVLVTLNGQSMLIDGGNNGDESIVGKYLTTQKITRLSYLVGTHPHEDHIGGLDGIVTGFDIDKIYLPKIKDSLVPTTKTYTDLLEAIQKKRYKVSTAKAGVTFSLDGAEVEILSPEKDSDNLNNYSAVLRVTYGNTALLFTGDAEEAIEKELLNKGVMLKSDFLKVGHHGSNTSSSSAFLKAVSPELAAISCGKNNTYGHPSAKVLDRFKTLGVQYNRTDTEGTLVYGSDGENVYKK